MAIAGLAERLVKKVDPRTDVRLLYIEVLAHINTDEARGPLAMCAMDDPVEEVRLSSLDELVKQKNGAVKDYFVRRMRNKHATNADINHAAVALGRIKDPSTIDTLIESLVTVHDEIVRPAANPGQMTTGFSKNGGGGGISMNQKPVKIRRHLQNPDVLDALVAITGQNFGYDQRAWAPGTRTSRPRACRLWRRRTKRRSVARRLPRPRATVTRTRPGEAPAAWIVQPREAPSATRPATISNWSAGEAARSMKRNFRPRNSQPPPPLPSSHSWRIDVAQSLGQIQSVGKKNHRMHPSSSIFPASLPARGIIAASFSVA